MSDDDKTIGNLYVNDYKTMKKHPDYTGYLDISHAQIRDCINKGKAGEEVKLKLGLWIKPSKRDPNEQRFFIIAETDKFKSKADKKSGWDDDVPF